MIPTTPDATKVPLASTMKVRECVILKYWHEMLHSIQND